MFNIYRNHRILLTVTVISLPCNYQSIAPFPLHTFTEIHTYIHIFLLFTSNDCYNLQDRGQTILPRSASILTGQHCPLTVRHRVGPPHSERLIRPAIPAVPTRPKRPSSPAVPRAGAVKTDVAAMPPTKARDAPPPMTPKDWTEEKKVNKRFETIESLPYLLYSCCCTADT